MSYVLNLKNATINLPVGSSDTTTPIRLIGRNWTGSIAEGYGQALNQNFLKLLENFASTPTGPSNPVEGQFWYDPVAKVMKYNDSSVPAFPNWVGLLTSGGATETTFITTGDPANAGQIEGTWTLTAGSTLHATYADIAEYYLSDREYPPGTVVQFGGEFEITLCNVALTKRVAGVVSTNPAMVMNTDVNRSGISLPIALMGRVPVLVRGTAFPGDLIVAATNGAAMAWNSTNDPPTGTVIGKAIHHKTDTDTQLLEVLVGVR
jgi:hypothetical protein